MFLTLGRKKSSQPSTYRLGGGGGCGGEASFNRSLRGGGVAFQNPNKGVWNHQFWWHADTILTKTVICTCKWYRKVLKKYWSKNTDIVLKETSYKKRLHKNRHFTEASGFQSQEGCLKSAQLVISDTPELCEMGEWNPLQWYPVCIGWPDIVHLLILVFQCVIAEILPPPPMRPEQEPKSLWKILP